MTMTTITITHTPEDGTLAHGTQKGDKAGQILRDAGRFTFSSRIGTGGAWYIRGSRDRSPRMWDINAAVAALESAGYTVEKDIDTGHRTTAEREAARTERVEARQDALDAKADRKSAESDAAYARVQQIGDMIPLGQPILVGHHSEAHARRDIDKMDRGMRASVDASRESKSAANRAQASRSSQTHRESAPVTLRRIAKLVADQARFQRSLDGTASPWDKPATGASRDRIVGEIARLTEEIAYWQEHVKQLEADGVKVWSKADFTKGDFVRYRFGWREVLRANAKSLTVPAGTGAIVKAEWREYSWNDTIRYDEVTGRKSAEDMAELLAPAEAKVAATA